MKKFHASLIGDAGATTSQVIEAHTLEDATTFAWAMWGLATRSTTPNLKLRVEEIKPVCMSPRWPNGNNGGPR